jgi:hypothetical protein
MRTLSSRAAGVVKAPARFFDACQFAERVYVTGAPVVPAQRLTVSVFASLLSAYVQSPFCGPIDALAVQSRVTGVPEIVHITAPVHIGCPPNVSVEPDADHVMG